MEKIQFISLAFSVMILYLVIHSVRKEYLRVEYSILWLVTALTMVTLSASPRLLKTFSDVVGIYYPPSAIFLVSTLFFLSLLFHLSVIVSRTKENTKRLAQVVGLLQWRVEQLERKTSRNE